MVTSHRKYLALVMVLAASFACAIPSVPAPSVDSANTAAIQNGVQDLPATLEILPTATFTPTVTSAPLIIEASITPSLTFTPYSIFGGATSTSIAQQIRVSVPTNCRSGPGKAYGVEGTLLANETAEVYGRDPTSEYLYIRNPDPGVEYCWVWGEFAIISDSLLALPIYMPPPTPSPTLTPTPVPSFDMEFIDAVKCTGWRMKIQITNTSSQPFKSVQMVIKDEATEVELTASSDSFADLDGCVQTAIKDMINPGETFVLSSPQFDDRPKGHNFRAYITLCTEKGWTNGCITRKINFKPK